MTDISITAADVQRGSDAVTKVGTGGATFTAGQPVFKDSTDAKMKLSDADGEGTRQVDGITTHGGADGQPCVYQTSGDIEIGATLVAGSRYYLSTTAGGIAPEADLEAGMDVILIGIAKSTSVLTLLLHDSGVTL